MASTWYVGLSDVRTISAARWAQLGVGTVAATTWDATNGYSIANSALNAAQIVILDLDDEFNVSAANGPRTTPIPPISVLVTESRLAEALSAKAEPVGLSLTTQAALSASYAGLIQLAKNPDSLVVGTVTGDPLTSAAVVWPNGVPGTLTITARHSTGAVNAYNITYGSPVTKTLTQPAITRATSGAATNVPQIVIS